jgi:hypothetical protein
MTVSPSPPAPPAPPTNQPTTVAISGSVKWEQSGQAARNLAVAAISPQHAPQIAQSAHDGSFSFPALPVGP